MSEKNAGIIQKCVNIATAVFTVVSGACLIWACLNVYRGGDGAYTRAAVAAALQKVTVPVCIWLVLVAAGWLCHLLLPGDGAKRAVGKKGAMRKGKYNRRAVLAVRISLAVIGLGLLITGAVTGGMADVLAKAINICTECVGLG